MNITYLDLDDIKNPLLGAGQAWATHFVGSELVKRGHSVTVICSNYPGAQDRIENGITYKHVGIATSNIKLNNLLFFFFAPLAVRKIRSQDSDVIIECFTAPISTLFSPLFTKVPVVALPSMFNAIEFTHKYKLPFHLIEAFGVRLYKYALPYSDIDNAKLHQLNPHITTQITAQGVSEEYFKIEPKTAKHILFLSRFDIAQKGIDLLLQAYKQITPQVKLPLVIAGHGPDEAKIKSLISDLDLGNQVMLVGSAYGEKKKKLMAEASFVAFPSRHDEMCLWTLEALAAGLPLVGFDIPESSWIPNEAMIKTKPFDVSELAQSMQTISLPKRNTQMRRAAQTFARRYSWPKVAEQFEYFLTNTVLAT